MWLQLQAEALLCWKQLWLHLVSAWMQSAGPFLSMARPLAVLGTSLRVDAVRKRLNDVSVRGERILDVLRWIAKASDAGRYLSQVDDC